MLNQNKGDPVAARKRIQKLPTGFKAAGRRANANNRQS